MNKNTIIYYLLRVANAIILFLFSLPSLAQGMMENDGGLSRKERALLEESEMGSDAPVYRGGFRTDELIAIAVLVGVILIVRQSVDKRERTGCTFFTIFIAIVLYYLWRYF